MDIFFAILNFLWVRWVWILAVCAETVARLRRMLWRGGEAVFGANLPPRPGDQSVSAAWVQQCLDTRWSAQKYSTSTERMRVAEVVALGLDGNRGLSGAISKLHINYTTEQPTFPTTLILKQTRCGVDGRRHVIAGGGDREALFLGGKCGLADSLSSLLPRVLYSYSSSWLGESVLLLEDVTTSRQPPPIPVNFVFGNQIWGIPQPLDPAPDPVRVLESIYLRAADWHAKYWNNPRLLDLSWLRSAPWYHGYGRVSWETSMQKARLSWNAFTARLDANPKPDVVVAPQLRAIIDRSLRQASWSALQHHLHDPSVPYTLCHGDFHASNMFLLDSGESAARLSDHPSESSSLPLSMVWFDWSEVGPWEPCADLAQTIISDIKPDLFREHSRRLVELYWSRLVAGGVSEAAYPLERCWADFCRCGAERWIWLFCILAGLGLPGKAVQYFHDQVWEFIRSHEPKESYVLKPVVSLAP